MDAKFITLEGIDGAGKSTHLSWITEFLSKRKIDVISTREPGGTALGEMLRELLLKEHMHPETEALLMYAARREHVDKKILPAMEAGKWVVSDRFSDASFAYQGGGRGVLKEKLNDLEEWALGKLQPDLTLLFDVPAEIGMARVKLNSKLDKFESEQNEFFQRVRAAYLERAAQFPNRIFIIDSARNLALIREELERVLMEKLF